MHLLNTWTQVIEQYYQLLSTSLIQQALVPEFLDQDFSQQPQPRALCQTRALIYLVHYAEIKQNIQPLKQAQKLYQQIRQHYLIANDKGFQPPTIDNGSALYELAFLYNAQTQLAFGEQNAGNICADLLLDRQYTQQAILSLPYHNWLQPRQDGQFYELNALMHLFEAITLAQQFEFDQDNHELLIQIGKTIKDHFWQPTTQLLAERIDYQYHVLEYDLGHNFEWCSLIALNQNILPAEFPLSPRQLIIAAEHTAQTYFAAIITHRLDQQTLPIKEAPRIWVNLERLRALALILPDQASNLIEPITQAFLKSGLPQEYFNQVNPIKSTTGYHLIECYRSLRQWQKLRSHSNSSLVLP